MGRKAKTGLSYFSKDVDYYDDFKIMDLMNEYHSRWSNTFGQDSLYVALICYVGDGIV